MEGAFKKNFATFRLGPHGKTKDSLAPTSGDEEKDGS